VSKINRVSEHSAAGGAVALAILRERRWRRTVEDTSDAGGQGIG